MPNPPIVRKRDAKGRLGTGAAGTRHGTEAGAGTAVELDRLSRSSRHNSGSSGRKITGVSNYLTKSYAFADFGPDMDPLVIPADNGVWAVNAETDLAVTAAADGLLVVSLYVSGGCSIVQQFPIRVEDGDSFNVSLCGSDTVLANVERSLQPEAGDVTLTGGSLLIRATRIGDIT